MGQGDFPMPGSAAANAHTLDCPQLLAAAPALPAEEYTWAADQEALNPVASAGSRLQGTEPVPQKVRVIV